MAEKPFEKKAAPARTATFVVQGIPASALNDASARDVFNKAPSGTEPPPSELGTEVLGGTERGGGDTSIVAETVTLRDTLPDDSLGEVIDPPKGGEPQNGDGDVAGTAVRRNVAVPTEKKTFYVDRATKRRLRELKAGFAVSIGAIVEYALDSCFRGADLKEFADTVRAQKRPVGVKKEKCSPDLPIAITEILRKIYVDEGVAEAAMMEYAVGRLFAAGTNEALSKALQARGASLRRASASKA